MTGLDPKGQRNQRELINLGCDYADAAPQYFSEKRPGELILEELKNFYLGCGGTVIANMYGVICKAQGREKADEWLAKVFMGIPAMVQTKVPVLLTINANSRPMETALENDAQVKPGLIGKPVGKCTCELNPDGKCVACLERMKHTMKTIMVTMGKYMKAMGDLSHGIEKGCEACSLRYLDSALASVIEEELLPGGPGSGVAFGSQFAAFVEGLAHQMGVKELPLTEKAWAHKEREAN